MDQCRKCAIRGDLKACLSEPCNLHESWFAMELTKNIQSKQKEIDKLKAAARVKKR